MRKRLRKKKDKQEVIKMVSNGALDDYINHSIKSGIYSIPGVGLIHIDMGKDVIYNIAG
jgi:hypothetical protein